MYDIAIIGCGRVGLPLGLTMREIGFNVCGVDIDINLINTVKNKKMPFLEPGYNDLIKQEFKIFNSKLEDYPDAKAYIITVGTPLSMHIETNMDYVINVIKELIEKVNLEGKLIILRSTIAPNTTKMIKNILLTKDLIVGSNVFLTMCPERIVEGDAYNELHKLAQIIGTDDDKSYELTYDIFSKLEIKIFKTSYIEAELSKLFTNIYRYINFSIPNYFSYIADHFDVDIFNLLNLMKIDYPRNDGLKNPGFAGGSCLRKDFGMINENFPQTDLILQAYKINEFMPKFYVDLVKDKIFNKTIGILGYTMKSNTDDMRDSLIPKLIRYINKLVPKSVLINDCILTDKNVNNIYDNHIFKNESINYVIDNSDIIFIAMNHYKYYDKNLYKDCSNKIIIDIWGVLNQNLVNYL